MMNFKRAVSIVVLFSFTLSACGSGNLAQRNPASGVVASDATSEKGSESLAQYSNAVSDIVESGVGNAATEVPMSSSISGAIQMYDLSKIVGQTSV